MAVAHSGHIAVRRDLMLPAVFLVACRSESVLVEKPEPSETSTPSTETTPTTPTPTGDTGESTPTTTWTGLYPLVPFDCSQPLAPGPMTAVAVPGVLTTEDFTIDPDGWLVSSDWDQNLMHFDVDGNVSVFVPNAAETRGIDVLPDGDVVITDESTNQLRRVTPEGVVSPIGSAGSSPSGIDVGSDGSVYVGDITTGRVYQVHPDGTVENLGGALPPIQTYGAALSIDEQTLYVSQYNGGGLFRLQREGASWGDAEPWLTLDGFGLAGMAVDACDNLYVIASIGCRVFRVSPEGDVELLSVLDVSGDYCPSLGFGRDVGGWDPLTLYVSTYHTLAALPVGVPGKPR
jgi:sugar lactone lactonase YvrE